IVLIAARSRGCPSGPAYESSDLPLRRMAPRYARPTSSAGARRTSGRAGAKNSVRGGTSYGRSREGEAGRSSGGTEAVISGFVDENRVGRESGKSGETNVP